MHFRLSFAMLLIASLSIPALTGCRATPETEGERQALRDEGKGAVAEMRGKHPELGQILDDAYGYAIFPSVGKGGLIVGGSYGRGEVYRENQFVGYADITQLTVGAQAGGQEFSELIVFQTEDAFNRFRNDQFALAANASAIALKEGAAVTANFQDGVAVFTMAQAGAMVEAAVGGQKFDFTASDDAQAGLAGATTRPAGATDRDRDVDVDVDVDRKE